MNPLDHWHYEMDAAGGIEVGRWRGDSAPLLSRHFHPEAQFTYVLRGSRLLQVGDRMVMLLAGEGRLIPPLVAHQGVASSNAGTVCVNLYIPSDKLGSVNTACGRPEPGSFASSPVTESVSRLAARAGLSREAFTRNFARRNGFPPAAYRLLERLNEARRRLRHGASLADVAVELGFADQSHLGRLFKRAFGATPAAYRKGLRSQTI